MKKLAFLSLFLSSTLFAQTIPFTLKAQVFDDGQKITTLELETKNLQFDRKKLNANTFRVHAKGTLPIDAKGNEVHGVMDNVRQIKKAVVNQYGNIELQLADDNFANTLAYINGDIARNVVLNLDYQIQLQAGDFLPDITNFKQGALVDTEVDRFASKVSKSGLAYQFFQPENLQKNSQKRPLVIWLHGNGESGTAGYQNPTLPLLANRGALAFAEPTTQRIFGGAYVIAPQAPDTWYYNYKNDYLNKINILIDEVASEHAIDRERVYLFGASAGGYMVMRLLIDFPERFAGASVAAPALDRALARGGKVTTEDELAKIKGKPLWLVHAVDDPTISYTATSKWVYQQLRDSGAILSAYPSVQIGEKAYNGHWSWIYSARNLPTNPQGERLFQWMAKQRLSRATP